MISAPTGRSHMGRMASQALKELDDLNSKLSRGGDHAKECAPRIASLVERGIKGLRGRVAVLGPQDGDGIPYQMLAEMFDRVDLFSPTLPIAKILTGMPPHLKGKIRVKYIDYTGVLGGTLRTFETANQKMDGMAFMAVLPILFDHYQFPTKGDRFHGEGLDVEEGSYQCVISHSVPSIMGRQVEDYVIKIRKQMCKFRPGDKLDIKPYVLAQRKLIGRMQQYHAQMLRDLVAKDGVVLFFDWEANLVDQKVIPLLWKEFSVRMDELFKAQACNHWQYRAIPERLIRRGERNIGSLPVPVFEQAPAQTLQVIAQVLVPKL